MRRSTQGAWFTDSFALYPSSNPPAKNEAPDGEAPSDARNIEHAAILPVQAAVVGPALRSFITMLQTTAAATKTVAIHAALLTVGVPACFEAMPMNAQTSTSK